MPFLLQAAAYASETGVLSEAMIDEKVNDAMIAHKKKVIWQSDQTLYTDSPVSKKAAIMKGETPTS